MLLKIKIHRNNHLPKHKLYKFNLIIKALLNKQEFKDRTISKHSNLNNKNQNKQIRAFGHKNINFRE